MEGPSSAVGEQSVAQVWQRLGGVKGGDMGGVTHTHLQGVGGVLDQPVGVQQHRGVGGQGVFVVGPGQCGVDAERQARLGVQTAGRVIGGDQQGRQASASVAVAGIPAAPTGQARTDLPAVLRKVNPDLVADPDKAIDNTRNQCSAINGKSVKVDVVAQARFSNSTHTVSPAEAKKINAAIGAYCKTAQHPSSAPRRGGALTTDARRCMP